MKYTFYTDLHIGNKYLNMDIITNSPYRIEKENAYTLGDIFDLKNCSKQDYPTLIARKQSIDNAFLNRCVSGNHDPDTKPLFLNIPGDILLTHGDYVLWDFDKFAAFRAEQPAQGVNCIKWLISKWNGTLSKKEKQKLATFATEQKCNTIIIGHVHPKTIIDEMINGIRVICLPRGRTEIVF